MANATTSELAIEAVKLGKAYRRYDRALDRSLEFLSFGSLVRHREFWALRDIDFAVARGETLGLVGGNGAGKSTLLKLLAGTSFPSEGRYRIRGRVSGLLELGAGFHLDLSGRENLALAGSLLGIQKAEIRRMEPEILDFAEIGEFVDQPVRTYSTGMAVRLSFALATAVDPDVLLIDEVFAVGDMYFQKKCIDRVLAFKRAGKTIVVCSHSLYDIRQLCDRALWLDRGRARAIGDATEVTNDYATFQREHGAHESSNAAPPSDLPHVLDARIFRSGTSEELYEIKAGESIELRIWWKNPDVARHSVQLGVGFMRQDRTTIAGLATHIDGLDVRGASGCATLELPELGLLAGQFTLLVVLFDGDGVHRYHEFTLPEPLVVRAHTREIGLFRVPHRWRLVENEAPPELARSTARSSESARTK